MDAEVLLAIISSLLQNGPKAIEAISQIIREKKDGITSEDIDKLFITKTPEEYFE